MFVKFWQPKAVKTRLAAGLGDVQASEMYRDFVFHLLVRHSSSCDSRELVFSPESRISEFRQILPRAWDLTPQSDGDLGTRMRRFFEDQFSRTDSPDDAGIKHKVIVIGTDCPQLDREIIESALLALDDASVVIGPSTDGGYYLIGMSEMSVDVFTDIAWSTSDVLTQTIARLDERQIRYHLLAPLTDIDERGDLMKLEYELRNQERDGILDELDLQLLIRIKRAMSDDPKLDHEAIDVDPLSHDKSAIES